MSMRTKFTPERQAVVLEVLRRGALLSGAAKHAGVSRQTLYNWLTSTEDKYLEFQERVDQAQGFAQVRIEMAVYAHDPKFWLLCGPARERYDADGNLIEGWARGPGRPPRVKEVPVPTAPSGEELVKAVLTAIEEAPDLRAKFLAALAEKLEADRPVQPAATTAEPVKYVNNGDGAGNAPVQSPPTVNVVKNGVHPADPVKNVKIGEAAAARPPVKQVKNGVGPSTPARGDKKPDGFGITELMNNGGNCLPLAITG